MLQRKLGLLGLICGMLLISTAHGQALKTIQPFEIQPKSMSAPTISRSVSSYQDYWPNHDASGFDYFNQSGDRQLITLRNDSIFGQELAVGMRFSDWLSLRLAVIDEEQNLFLSPGQFSRNNSDQDLMGYQFGVSSVLNLSPNWRFGIDLGRGRIQGDLLGLYADQLDTTRLGFGVRNNRFGASFQSDFMSRSSDHELEQSTLDFQLDWHFTKDGTLSFGARKNIREPDASTTAIDELTGTVPYIKFKHNL